MNSTSMRALITVMMTTALFAAVGILNSCGDIDHPAPPPSGFLLSAPVGTAAIGVGPNPTLIWTDATGETGYTVQVSTSRTFTTDTFSQILPADTTSYLVSWSSVTTGVQYYWQVLATNNRGATKASNAPFSFTP